ncbi:MAG: FtsX-like permease family protein, partial [Candidatus Heimdallarchaeota archaeon]|nr:FtsX-like permease family protein [Candidatus Heimdallarchaeota archaeon]MCK5049244.1 FtsX-like permease family protein [Candidatus Heimdallarchaeota archaeon]
IDPDEAGFEDFYKHSDKSEELYLSNLAANEVFIGSALAVEMKVVKGDIIAVSYSQGNVSGYSEFTIRDIYDEDKGKGREAFGMSVSISLEKLQELLNEANVALGGSADLFTNKINKISVNFNSEYHEDGLLQDQAFEKVKERLFDYSDTNGLIPILPPSISDEQFIEYVWHMAQERVDTIEMIDDVMDSMVQMMNVFGTLIIAAGLLVIVNIQLMSIEEKENQTGVLRAIGTRKGVIIFSSLIENTFLGMIASFIGLLGGIAYGWFLEWVFAYSFGFSDEDLPLIITQDTLVLCFVSGLLLAIISGIYPSIKASRVNIVDVLRGIDRPAAKKLGRKSIYFGALLSVLSALWYYSLDVPSLLKGKEAFRDLEDVEAMYLPVLLFVTGVALLSSYFGSRKISLNVLSLFMLAWPLFNIFYVFDWLETGQGGMLWITYIIMSLIIGNVLLMGLNLDVFAALGEKIVGLIPRLRATGMVAFRQMSSNKTRSTLTFALFATILSMNIFFAAWNYSARYGLDEGVNELSGNTDLIVSITSPVSKDVRTDWRLEQNFAEITTARSVSISSGYSYLDHDKDNPTWKPSITNDTEAEIIYPTSFISIENNTFWSEDIPSLDNWVFQYDLFNNKSEEYEDGVEYPEDEMATEEDHVVWKALAENTYVTTANPDNPSEMITIPIILPSMIFEMDQATYSVKMLKEVGDVIYLEAKNGSLMPFYIAAIVNSNPLIDFLGFNEYGPTLGNGFFVASEQAAELKVFDDGLFDLDNYILIESEHPLKSDANGELAREIESWANSASSEYRAVYGMHSLYVVEVYDIYELQLEGQYRFFNFLQTFISLGFVVGILGLMVVSLRAVSERKREIGMLRAIGYKKLDVILAVLFELITLSIIGWLIGMFNGLIVAERLVNINYGDLADFLIPWWPHIAIYSAITFGASFVAAIIPGWLASKIPPSEALRYQG